MQAVIGPLGCSPFQWTNNAHPASLHTTQKKAALVIWELILFWLWAQRNTYTAAVFIEMSNLNLWMQKVSLKAQS